MPQKREGGGSKVCARKGENGVRKKCGCMEEWRREAARNLVLAETRGFASRLKSSEVEVRLQ